MINFTFYNHTILSLKHKKNHTIDPFRNFSTCDVTCQWKTWKSRCVTTIKYLGIEKLAQVSKILKILFLTFHYFISDVKLILNLFLLVFLRIILFPRSKCDPDVQIVEVDKSYQSIDNQGTCHERWETMIFKRLNALFYIEN